MAERNQEIGREFVKKTVEFIDKSFGFNVFMDSYTDCGGLTFYTTNNKPVYFDIILNQEIHDNSTNPPSSKKKFFICECKKRNKAGQLKKELKDFLIKILSVDLNLNQKFANYNFIFFHNKPFSITQEKLRNVEFLEIFLDKKYSTNQIVKLHDRLYMINLDDWFLDLTACGRR